MRRQLLLGGALAFTTLGAGCEACRTGGGEGTVNPEAGLAQPTATAFVGDASLKFPSFDGGDDAGVLNATSLAPAAIARMVNPENLPAYHGPTGSVEGTVYVTGDAPAQTPADFHRCPGAAALYGHAFREGPLPASADKTKRPLADSVVGVTGYTGFFVPESKEAKESAIEGCGFTARTVTMTFGERLEVKNNSKEFWTPTLTPSDDKVVMMAPPHGDAVKIYPKKPGHYLLTDRDRPYASVDLYVFLHPLHAATDSLGHYRIDGIPAGMKLSLSTRHPHIADEKEVDITVEADKTKTVDLVLKNEPHDASGPAPAPLSTIH